MRTFEKLANHPYAQCCVERHDCGIVFWSYRTAVIVIDNDGWLHCTGTYSQTTRRQMGWFMREYVTYPNGKRGSYADAKQCYEKHFDFNVYTGEIREC